MSVSSLVKNPLISHIQFYSFFYFSGYLMEFGGIGWNQKKTAMGKEKMVLVKKEEEEIGEFEQIGYLEEGKKKKGIVSGSGLAKKGSGGCVEMKNCQAEKCTADLIDAKQYHRRHKVCEHHAKAQVVLVAGTRQRFCQQCSRFGLKCLYFIWHFFWFI